MQGVNKVILVGTVGKDPEVHYIDNGIPYARFSLATNESYKNKNGEKTTITEWHNIVVWRGLAEIAEKYIKKGEPLYIEGQIRSRSYDDKKGNKRDITEIAGKSIVMLGKPPQNKENNTEEQEKSRQIDYVDTHIEEADDLPF